ncbi:hypothetical protein [Campylobacter mucosalis]|uniref:hypothetical protein n=1 Tax=Campylobacter mucosalis TaxID=202 RepID=UPI00146FC939|nr:hypothetical protein [Campylobacter mucosalis]
MFEKNFTQKDLDDIDSELKELEPILSCYCSKNKEQKQNRLKLLLSEERDIVTQSIKSTDTKERKELYLKFLEKESMLYDEYDSLPEKCSMDKEINIKHNLNSIKYYLQIFTKKLFTNKVFSAIGFALLGAIFCFPYFFWNPKSA